MRLKGRAKFIGKHEDYSGKIDLEANVKFLEEHRYWYVVTDGLEIAGGPPCECDCLNALVYTQKAGANEVLKEMKGKNPEKSRYSSHSVRRITPKFFNAVFA